MPHRRRQPAGDMTAARMTERPSRHHPEAEQEHMSTEKQKEAARRNIEKAREVQSERAHGEGRNATRGLVTHGYDMNCRKVWCVITSC
jgi:hypothetical protein